MHDELSNLLTTKLRERKLSSQQAADTTGVPVDVIEQLASGDHANLPAAPYLHGYLVKLGDLLDFDGEGLWQQMKRVERVKSSGTGDLLPKNRFSRNRAPRWLLWGVPLALVLVTFLGFRFAEIIGLPDVAITNPDRDGIVFTESPAKISGTATPGSRVTINGEAVPLTEGGTWEKDVNLQPGTPNDFTVEASKLLGRSRSTSRRMFYEAPMATTSTSTTEVSTTTLDFDADEEPSTSTPTTTTP
jgi:hypothetical protein